MRQQILAQRCFTVDVQSACFVHHHQTKTNLRRHAEKIANWVCYDLETIRVSWLRFGNDPEVLYVAQRIWTLSLLTLIKWST